MDKIYERKAVRAYLSLCGRESDFSVLAEGQVLEIAREGLPAIHPAIEAMKDAIAYRFKVVFHLVVPEAQRFEAFPCEMGVPFPISRILRMLATVSLDNQSASKQMKSRI
ncbi:MAG: hypothetical protein Kow0026_16450 [Oricola sp.]